MWCAVVWLGVYCVWVRVIVAVVVVVYGVGCVVDCAIDCENVVGVRSIVVGDVDVG